MKISHEIPKQLFYLHGIINDFPYLLGHLLYKDSPYYDKEYAEFYRNEIKKYPYSILDNGAYELGDSIDSDWLHELGQEYRPTHLILPDKLRDSKATIERAKRYIDEFYHKADYKLIGVVQGEDLEDSYDCAKSLLEQPEIDVIAIPFDVGGGRTPLLKELIKKDICREIVLKKIHFLGCLKPQEIFNLLDIEKQYIYSVDTSAPIICGWKRIMFTEKGYIEPKPEEKLAENLDMNITNTQLQLIVHNVLMFKTYARSSNTQF